MVNQRPGNAAVQRLQLRTELRKFREQVGLTQRQVAKTMEWSPSKLLRIESGEVGISVHDLRPLLSCYRVRDEGVIERLLDLARGSRKMPFAEYRDVYGQPFLNFLAMESSAFITRAFQPLVVPGLLQTEDYAAELSRAYSADRFSEPQLQRLIEGRLLRQEALDRDEGETYFIVDEAVLRRQIGGPQVMRRQLRRLAELAAHPRRQIMIFPFSSGTPASQGPFTLFEFEEQGIPPFVYLENLRTPPDVSTDEGEFNKLLALFWDLEERSIKGDQVPQILLQMAEHMETAPHDLVLPSPESAAEDS
ncbi:helix-turn-helix domain-containing protein [Streptomyces sp. NPDC057280]|uniref:helix-turn-helix domain-containing protein n=1 Tax=Streptomyces sp. NPDC057280 TaxID=3346081 RepID=UPI00363CE6A1